MSRNSGEAPKDRRGFIGGSDARIIMSPYEAALISQPAPAGAPLWVKMVAGRAVLSEPWRGDRAEADFPCGGCRPRLSVRPAPHRGTILCRPRKRGARVAVSRMYLRRHGRLLMEGGENAGAH